MLVNRPGLPVSFGGLGCRRAGYIALPSFISSMNSVGELVVTILTERTLTNLQRLWSLGGGLVVVLPCLMT